MDELFDLVIPNAVLVNLVGADICLTIALQGTEKITFIAMKDQMAFFFFLIRYF